MNKRKTTLTVMFLLLGIAVLGLVGIVYAKYISTITKNGTATVARWAFTSDNSSGDVTCELDETYDSSTLVADKIAPGTSGKCPIEISNENTEVGIQYSIAPSTVTNQPTNLKFYSDSAHQNEITSSVALTGSLAPEATSTTVYVYWNWPYEGSATDYDTHDTTDGTSASTMTMTFTVTGTQIQPAVANP